MPPKTERKEKPVKGDAAEELVLAYLRDVNRPYASTVVSANLKGKVTKAEAQKALTALAEKGSLTVKLYGKQTIFVYNQSHLDVLDPEEMARLDDQLKAVKEILDERRKELKSLQSDLAALEAQPKTKELNDAIRDGMASNQLTLESLKAFRGGSAAPPMSAKDTAKIDADWERWRKEWVSRKKVYNALYGMLADGGLCAGPRSDFEEEQGMEGDDDETKAIEAGEFCKPAEVVPLKRKQVPTTSVGTAARTCSAKAKRARS